MWHNLVWIGGIWLVALVFAWLICHWRGYNAAAWAFLISAFCLGLFVGAENTTHGIQSAVPLGSAPPPSHTPHGQSLAGIDWRPTAYRGEGAPNAAADFARLRKSADAIRPALVRKAQNGDQP